MVKENQIPIQKPVEEVKYVDENYQTQSFEEFMKDYKVDENLNYDDLSGGEVKGYGPCYKNCGGNNPHCSYQEGMYLKFPCPAKDCPDKGQGTIYEGVHATDYGDIKVSDCANMKCSSCGTVHHMKDGHFKCPKHVAKHQGDKKYGEVDWDSFNIALNAVFKIEGNPDVLTNLRLHVIQHANEGK